MQTFYSKCIYGNDEWSMTFSSQDPYSKTFFICHTYKTTKEYPLSYLSLVKQVLKDAPAFCTARILYSVHVIKGPFRLPYKTVRYQPSDKISEF